MIRIQSRLHIICVVLGFLAMVPSQAETARNYWQECLAAGEKSEEALAAYVTSLKAEELLLLGKQGGQEIDEKSQKATKKDRLRIEDEYGMPLGLVLGLFLENAKDSERFQVLTKPLTDSRSPRIWRKVILLGLPDLGDTYPGALRWDHYALIDVLETLLKANNEDIDMRVLCCQSIGRLLLSEYQSPSTSREEKKLVKLKMDRNIELCDKLSDDKNTPEVLVRTIEIILQRYHELGVVGPEKRITQRPL